MKKSNLILNREIADLKKQIDTLLDRNIDLKVQFDLSNGRIDECNSKLHKIDKLQSLLEGGCYLEKRGGNWHLYSSGGDSIVRDRSLMNAIFMLELK